MSIFSDKCQMRDKKCAQSTKAMSPLRFRAKRWRNVAGSDLKKYDSTTECILGGVLSSFFEEEYGDDGRRNRR